MTTTTNGHKPDQQHQRLIETAAATAANGGTNPMAVTAMTIEQARRQVEDARRQLAPTPLNPTAAAATPTATSTPPAAAAAADPTAPPANPLAALAPVSGLAGLAGFDTATAADDYDPIPPGVYSARVVKGEYVTTRKGEDAYRVRFEVLSGEQTGRTVIRTWTFGPKALPYAKRDLAVFGLTTSAHLLSTYPHPGREVRVRLVVALQTGDDGLARNDVKRIEITSDTATPDAAYLLPANNEGGPTK
jgi:hypothetical protein